MCVICLYVFRINETKKISWGSFLDGLQRVILFTDDPNLAAGAHTMGEAEFVDTEFVLSMQGMGLSLVNDPILQEIIYMSISRYVLCKTLEFLNQRNGSIVIV